MGDKLGREEMTEKREREREERTKRAQFYFHVDCQVDVCTIFVPIFDFTRTLFGARRRVGHVNENPLILLLFSVSFFILSFYIFCTFVISGSCTAFFFFCIFE